ncbi:MAG: tetratricopeptide repeat protein [Paracoccaceae bacterium]|nr:tetratricopeptide repeat protein [Paracoccaceae bacterium]
MKLTLIEALEKGVQAHKSGRLGEADQYYTAILKAQPSHSDANHNMGVLAVGIGKVEGALPFFKKALDANASITQYWLSYIDALIAVGRLDDAKVVFDQAKDKGIKGKDLDKLEQKFRGLTPNKDGTTSSANQKPLQDQINSLNELYNQRQFKKVLDRVSHLLQKFPTSAFLHNMCGRSYTSLSQLDAALMAYNKAVTIKPDYADAYYNMGVVLNEQDKPKQAIKAYNKALDIKPDFTQAYYNMANTFKEQGNLEKAIEAYQKALDNKPDYAEAYNNMGNALKEQGKLEKAIGAYNKALDIKPDYLYAYSNIGAVLQKQGKSEEAVDAYYKALDIKPDYAEAFYNMGVVLKRIIFTKPNPYLQVKINSLLDQKIYVRPVDIALAVISLLKFEPSVQTLFQKHPGYESRQSLENILTDLSHVPLLLKLMSVCPLPDLKLEDSLKNLRAHLLLSVSQLTTSLDMLRFQSALALQCFTNEYIYDQSDSETEALKILEASVDKALSDGKQPSPQSILCLASYKALNEYEWFDTLTVTNAIDEVFKRQVLEPNEEARLKPDIQTLEKITDVISSKVKEQYEVNPYPRWVNLELPIKPAPISQIAQKVKLKLFVKRPSTVNSPDILIAGCGTGQHSIGSAKRFKNSKVLAIDLSLSSLAYAKRKTKELGVQNIEYMQADILDLGKLDRQFDIIESVGVLHHMDEPMAGWKVLTDCLKKDGLMKIGLYSELARQHIVKMREEINQLKIKSNDIKMKSFRSMLIKSNKEHHKTILSSGDFYSLSMLRDLLFHIREHRFTIARIQDFLAELDLKFCGFEAKNLVLDFSLKNTGKDDPYDLDKWNAYEKANPRAFAGMYQFWCQKVVR